ncbi:cytochrome P450 55A3 isoform B [Chlorella sorokiniana]|nr:cytochrome P450 55A3 isoform B [Chlorella sorokiniana]|eukprot:PRW58572.1 cytochrome P450 55A3 isoform B [Chlorella sorokiniana]
MSTNPETATDVHARPSFPMMRPEASVPPEEYAKLRKTCPVSKAKLFDGSDIWLITKHRDLVDALRDQRFSKVRTHPDFPELVEGAKAAVEGREPTFVDMDPPDWTRFRGMFERWFAGGYVEKLRPTIRGHVKELLDGMQRASKPVNLHEAFSLPVAFKTIYGILGIPFEDFEFLSNNIAMRSSGSSTARDAAAAQQELVDYMEKLVKEKERNPGNDMLSEIVKNDLRNGNISRDQLIAHAFLLVVAGNATVASMINLGVVELLANPDQLAAFKEDPEACAPGLALEICRFHSASALALRRVALEDVQLGGQTIRKNEGIIALNMSANRDEEVFRNADKFDIRRPEVGEQVAYGAGIHRCIAEYLALVELQEAFKGLFGRFPNIKLAVDESELEWSAPQADVGLKSLPVTW